MSTRPFAGFWLVLVTVLVLHAVSAEGQEAPPRFDLAQLMAQFAGVKSGTAQFTERRYLRVLKGPLIDSGILIYAAPNRLEKKTLSPAAEDMVIDGDTLTIVREGKTETLSLSSYPQIGAFIEGIRATLGGDLGTLQQIYETDLQGDFGNWSLALHPRDPAMRAVVVSIDISGNGVAITRVQTIEHDGDRTDMRIVGAGP
jgi:outer membrane lipoprotein carrier protein LolA